MEKLKDGALSPAAKVSNATITERQQGDVMVLDVEGNLVVGKSLETIRTTIPRLLATGHRQILLNLAEVRRIDSSGVGELASSLVAVNRTGGQIKLPHVQPNLKEVLKATKVLLIFDVYEDELTALNAFA